MTVRVYQSTDTSAPVLTGAVGSLIALLDAVLVTGYGTKTAAGWTKPFSATNKAVFKTAGQNGYFRIVDDGTAAAFSSAKYAGVRGYGAMTDVDTGTDPFPTTSQQATNQLWYKSATADATARGWVIIADQYTCHLLIDTASNLGTTGYALHSFGDCYSYKAADAYKSYLTGNYNTTYLYSYFTYLSPNAAATGKYVYMPRSYTQTGTAQECGSFTDRSKTNQTSTQYHAGAQSAGALTYPNPVDGGLYQSRLYLNETNSPYPVRGFMRGLWNALHNRPLANGDTFTGVGATSGKTFQCFKISSSLNNASVPDAQINIEISDTWEISA